MLDNYRDRGTMEGHIREQQSVLDGRLSSTNRCTSEIKHNPIQERIEPVDAERANAAALLLHGLGLSTS